MIEPGKAKKKCSICNNLICKYYKNKEYRKKKNKRDVENLKMKYNTDIVFRTNHKAYMVNRYWTEPEFREKSLARSKAWRDARK